MDSAGEGGFKAAPDNDDHQSNDEPSPIDDPPDYETGPLPWGEWEASAFRIALGVLQQWYWLVHRDGGPHDLALWAGFEGYRRARERFDPARGDFESFLRLKIRQVVAEVGKACDYTHWHDQAPLSDDLSNEQTSEPSPERVGEQDDLRRQLRFFVEQTLAPEDQRLFWAVHANHSSSHITDAASYLGWSVERTHRAWERIRYRFRQDWPQDGQAGMLFG